MTFDQFIHLEPGDQLDSLSENGAYIGSKKQWGEHTSLYQVENFYVEVSLNDSESITKVRSFTSVDRIGSYLKRISIAQLLKKILFVPLAEVVEILEPICLLV